MKVQAIVGRICSNSLRTVPACAFATCLVLACGFAVAQQDKYSLKVPGGLALGEFEGYETWQLVSTSQNDRLVSAIVANPIMIEAYKSGIPDNGKPFPDGAKMVKIHWTPAKNKFFPETVVPGTQHDVDLMVKDSKRFADSGGWGYAYFLYDVKSDTFRPATVNDQPPQENDAKCGYACHATVENRDYVFTYYQHR
jgi:hypothetical protein